MSATLTHAATESSTAPVWAIGAPRLLAGLDRAQVLDLRSHLAVHGPLPATDLVRLLGLLEIRRLAGRGGAGFDFGTKLRALTGRRTQVVVNGCESEPASFKDRTLMRRSPHLVLDGALTVARVIAARSVTIAVHDRQAESALLHAVRERPDARAVRITRIEPAAGAAGYVGGQAQAVLRALAGGAALPPGRHQHATERGVLLSNVETFAQLAILLRLGAHDFGATGTRAEPGTALLTITGAVARPGVVEIPLGTPLGIVLNAAGAGTVATSPVQAVVIGGYHGSWHSPIGAIQLSRAGLAAAGGTFGAGVLQVLDDATCALGELARVTGWLAGESANQCGPCRFGLPALAHDVDLLYRGIGAGLPAALAHTRVVQGRGACHHPDGTTRFVTSGLHLLHDEADRHLAGGCGRPVLGRLSLGGTR